jgi:hypothetical protein
MYVVDMAHEKYQYSLKTSLWQLKSVEFNSVNKVLLTYISALFEFLSNIMTSVHGYEKDKVLTFNSGKDFIVILCLWYL